MFLQVAFGIDLNAIHEPDSPFSSAIKESLIAPIWCFAHPLHAIEFTTYGYQNSVIAAIHFLRDTGKKIIDERKKAILNGDEVPTDILSYILKSMDEDTVLDYEELLDHFVTFFIAGKLRLCLPEYAANKGASGKCFFFMEIFLNLFGPRLLRNVPETRNKYRIKEKAMTAF